MKQLIYSMRFTGRATPVAGSPSVMKATTTAPSCRLITIVGAGGVEGNFETVSGDTARFESEVTITGEASSDTLASQTRLREHGASGAAQLSFLEAGSIVFGEGGHRLTFSTVGQGYLADSAQAGLKHGTVTWRVDSGTGQFEGASGLITSNLRSMRRAKSPIITSG